MPFASTSASLKYVATVECDTNRHGGDKPGSMVPNIESWEKCAEECSKKAKDGCVAFSWQIVGHSCYLKLGEVPLARKEAGTWSGVMQTLELR
jgi:hypothetical protein